MKSLLFRNLGLKLLSLLFAVSLWLFVNLKASEQQDLRLPVRWENLPSLLEITNPVNDFVRVRVTGPRRILSNLDPSRFPVILDLADAKEGVRDYQISDKMIHLPPTLKGSILPPDSLQFKFDQVVMKEVPIKPRVAGSVADGYAVLKVEAEPDVIKVVGAQSEIQGITQVETAPVDVGNRKDDVQEKVRVVLNRMHVWPSPGMEHVNVRVIIREARVQVVLNEVPVTVIGAAGAAGVEPAKVEVLLEGPVEKIRAVEQAKVETSVTLPPAARGTYTLPVEVRSGVEGVNAKANPERVVVSVRESKRPR